MLGLVLAFALAWQSVPPQAVEHAKAGIAAQQAGRLTDAISEFKQVTELAPTLPAGFVNLGAAYLQNGEFGAAIAPLRKSLELDPGMIGAHQMLGYALLAQGYAAEAIPHLEQAHAEDQLGIAELRVGKLPEAVTHLNAALSKKPNDPDLLYYLGRASGLLSKEAMDMLEASHPDSARAHQALGEGYAALKQVPEAEKEYREALRIEPNAPGVQLSLGQLYAAASQWPNAEEEFRAEARRQPGDAETAYSLGNALLQQGKLKEAATELERADKLRPQMPETLYALGKADALSGNTAAAEKAWSQVVAIETTSSLAAQAHFGLAGLYRKQGKAAEAEREMGEYQRIHGARR
jgi:tetratricopeptide (TPR) repeat protein